MKAPNNIFIDESRITELGGLSDAIVPDNRIEDSDICYIRKDIVDETVKTAEDHAYFAGQEKLREKILEWARETKEALENENIIRDDIRKGAIWELEEVINKIKSL